MRVKRTKPYFHQSQVFNHSKQSCTGRTLSRAICWYVLMLPRHLSVQMACTYEQLAAYHHRKVTQPLQAPRSPVPLCVMPVYGSGCGTLQGANVPVWFSPNICSI
jgi:hypothetical protein